MNLINQQLKKIKQEKRLGLMTHVVIGYPILEDTCQVVKLMAAEGVDFIELQIPFSDPLGDGPVIRAANARALAKGVKVADAFRLAEELTKEIKIPLLFMTYLNIAYMYGLKKFCQDARAAGISGLIIPDYNPTLEGREHFEEFAKENELILIRFAALGSSTERLKSLAKEEKGFVYCFSSYGVTGARKELDPRLTAHLQKLRGIFKQPLAVGFGISSARHIKRLKGRADIVVAGSVFLQCLKTGGLASIRRKMQELVGAL